MNFKLKRSVVLLTVVLGLLVITGCGGKQSAEPDPSTGYNPSAGRGASGPPAATGAHAPNAPKPPKAD